MCPVRRAVAVLNPPSVFRGALGPRERRSLRPSAHAPPPRRTCALLRGGDPHRRCCLSLLPPHPVYVKVWLTAGIDTLAVSGHSELTHPGCDSAGGVSGWSQRPFFSEARRRFGPGVKGRWWVRRCWCWRRGRRGDTRLLVLVQNVSCLSFLYIFIYFWNL